LRHEIDMGAGLPQGMIERRTHTTDDGRIQVLHVLPNMVQGGVENVIANLVAHSDSTQYSHHILVLGKDHSFESAFKDLPVSIHYLREMGTSERMQLARQTDIVHAMHSRTATMAAPFTKALHKPLIIGIHGTPSGTFRNTVFNDKIGPFLSKHSASNVVCCTDISADEIKKRGWDPARIRTITNGIDTGAFVRMKEAGRELRQSLNIPDNASVVGISARYSAEKDIPTFIKAAGLLKKKDPSKPVYFILCGRGVDDQNEELKTQLKQAGIYDQSRLLGVRNDMAKVYSAIDVLALSSTSEALSLALLEGTACGNLCVATEVGDHKKLMQTTGGISVPVRNPEALAEAIAQHLSLTETEKGMKMEAGRNAIVQQYDVHRMASQYDAVFAEAAVSAHKNAGVVGH
jgi:glycosyltransferase involved in cell wall biosynthesis